MWKEKEKKEDEETKLTEPSEEKKKKKRGSKVVADSDRGTQYVVLITEMPLKIELWKLKISKMCFQFP